MQILCRVTVQYPTCLISPKSYNIHVWHSLISPKSYNIHVWHSLISPIIYMYMTIRFLTATNLHTIQITVWKHFLPIELMTYMYCSKWKMVLLDMSSTRRPSYFAGPAMFVRSRRSSLVVVQVLESLSVCGQWVI